MIFYVVLVTAIHIHRAYLVHASQRARYVSQVITTLLHYQEETET